MRTTLTLDDDVALALKRLQERRRVPFKQLVNQALREGLQRLEAPRLVEAPMPFEGRNLGGCLLTNLDNVAEILAVAEGDDFR